jgi:O-antigen ligase
VVLVVGADAGGYFPKAWRLSTLALLAFAAAALIGRRRIQMSGLAWTLLAAFAALACWIAASAIWSEQPDGSVLEAERALVYLVGVAAILMVTERQTVRQLVVGIVAAITLVCGYSLALRAFGSGGLDPTEGDLLYKPLGYANALGILAALAILLAIGLGLQERTQLGRALCGVSLAILLSALYLTSSRGAWVGLALGLAFGLWCDSSKLRAVALLPVVAIAVAGAIVLGSRNGQSLALGDENRPHYWHVAFDDVAANPLLGSGAGTFDDFWLRHPPVKSFARDAHSIYIESLAELGPIGLVLVIAALGAHCSRSVEGRVRCSPPRGARTWRFSFTSF